MESKSLRPISEPEPSHLLRPYLTERELAEVLLITTRTIRDWRERGFIPYLKVRGTIRFDLAAVRKALETKFTVHEVHQPKRRKLRKGSKQKPRGAK